MRDAEDLPDRFYEVFVVDPEGVVRYAHRAVAGLTFRSTDELVEAVAQAGGLNRAACRATAAARASSSSRWRGARSPAFCSSSISELSRA